VLGDDELIGAAGVAGVVATGVGLVTGAVPQAATQTASAAHSPVTGILDPRLT
jgi:hypothetical protein